MKASYSYLMLIIVLQTTIPRCSTQDQFNSLLRLQSRLVQMAGNDFLELTGCYHPCTKEEVEVIKYTEIK